MSYDIDIASGTPRSSTFTVGMTVLAVLSCSSGRTTAASLEPSTVFVQLGAGDQETTAYLLGATWDLPWRRDFRIGSVSGYFEGGFGRWSTHKTHTDTAWPTQISVTPVVRLRPMRTPNYFLELGVGANYIVPVFDSGDKRFSTEFNFGDHVALGRTFRGRHPSEFAVRVEHFSNVGIEHPNPGENFLQLRYSPTF
jgi:lipid A 3-O-deacylase